MATIKRQLRTDMTLALRSGDKLVLNTLRGVLGEISTREKSGKSPVELDDKAVTALLQKQAARRRETAEIYTGAGQHERAGQEIAEAQVIEAYLPRPLTEDEVASIIDTAIASVAAESGTAPGMRQMGQVMKMVSAEVVGRFDGRAVSEMVKARLG